MKKEKEREENGNVMNQKKNREVEERMADASNI